MEARRTYASQGIHWLAFREQMYTLVCEAGYDDPPPAHVLLFRYPTLADMRPSQLAEQAGMSKQGVTRRAW